MTLITLLAAVVAASPVSPAPAEKPKLIVMALTPAGGLEPQIAEAFSEAITTEISRAGYFDVLSRKDVETLVGLERQRQLLGCADQTSCLTELAGAMGARFVLSGSVARLGPSFQLSLQSMDSSRAQAVGRTSRMANDLAVLRKQIPYAVAEATGTPPPPSPSLILPVSLMTGGGLALIGGGLVGMDALARERSLRDELALADGRQTPLRSFPEYQQLGGEIGGQKTVALVAMVAAAGLMGAGAWFWPRDAAGGAQALVLPSGNGFAFVGVFE